MENIVKMSCKTRLFFLCKTWNHAIYHISLLSLIASVEYFLRQYILSFEKYDLSAIKKSGSIFFRHLAAGHYNIVSMCHMIDVSYKISIKLFSVYCSWSEAVTSRNFFWFDNTRPTTENINMLASFQRNASAHCEMAWKKNIQILSSGDHSQRMNNMKIQYSRLSQNVFAF